MHAARSRQLCRIADKPRLSVRKQLAGVRRGRISELTSLEQPEAKGAAEEIHAAAAKQRDR